MQTLPDIHIYLFDIDLEVKGGKFMVQRQLVFLEDTRCHSLPLS